MLEPAIAKIIKRTEAYMDAVRAVFIRSFFDALLVITEKSAKVDEGLTIMNNGMNTNRNVWIVSKASKLYLINLRLGSCIFYGVTQIKKME